MTQLPTISELAGFAATPKRVPRGWLPLTDVMPPLDMVVERLVESAGHCHALFRIGGSQPHALILNQRPGKLGESSFVFTDREAAWNWAEQLGAVDDESISDIYQSSTWHQPKEHTPIVELSVHEYESETTPEAWVMLQCVCPMMSVQSSMRL